MKIYPKLNKEEKEMFQKIKVRVNYNGVYIFCIPTYPTSQQFQEIKIIRKLLLLNMIENVSSKHNISWMFLKPLI